MAKKNFILLSMDDSKIKKVSNVISNDSCRKILDFLAEKEATESEIASNLLIPISTVHYNLQQLMETGLVSADEFHYSRKGKEVQHYKLANKYIIIAPKSVSGIKDKLRGFLPAALITLAAAGTIQFVNNYQSKLQLQEAAQPMMAAKTAVQEMDSAVSMMQSVPPETAASIWQNIAVWFLIGAIFSLTVYFVWNLIRKKK